MAVLSLGFTTAGYASEDEIVVVELAMRPLGLVALGLGSATYLVTLPFTIVVGGREKMAEALVKRPYRFTFRRPMGEGLVHSETPHPLDLSGMSTQQE
jgi:hypothetical protein